MRQCEVRNTNSGNLLTTFFGVDPPHGAFKPRGRPFQSPITRHLRCVDADDTIRLPSRDVKLGDRHGTFACQHMLIGLVDCASSERSIIGGEKNASTPR